MTVFHSFFKILCGLILALSWNTQLLAQDSQPSSSVLANGSWFKIAVPGEGVYKIDYQFLLDAGIAPENIDPRKISLWGNGGQMLPQANAAQRPADLQQNAIMLSGEQDGVFDPQDYILFYATGPDTYRFDTKKGTFFYQKHLYADSSYYFIHIGEQNGLRMEAAENLGNNHSPINRFTDVYVHEKDQLNLLDNLAGHTGSGRQWFEAISNGSGQKSFSVEWPGLLADSEFKVISAVMASAYGDQSRFTLALNGTQLGSQTIEPLIEYRYAQKGEVNTDTFTLSNTLLNATDRLEITLKYQQQQADRAKSYLDYFLISGERQLRLYQGYCSFRSPQSLQQLNSTFRVAQAGTETQLWEVSNPLRPLRQEFELINNTLVFGASTTTLREFVAFDPERIQKPAFVSKIENQNLHALSSPDLLIISPAAFLPEAQRLAAFKRSHEGLSVEVVTTTQVYNEFASGSKDITALRDFAAFLYNQNPGKFKYLLLFGDCSFDYKNSLGYGNNWVPTYESRESLYPVNSYSSDDYFGFLEAHEGEWREIDETNHTLDIGIGRFPVQDLQEAKIIVDKVIHYTTSPQTLGEWRQELYFVADDGDNNKHQLNSETIAEEVARNHPEFNVNKLYLDAFPQQSIGFAEDVPLMKQGIRQAVERGALIINFTGHGSERKWTDENILNVSTIQKWKNPDRLPLFVTATCEFGRYDDPQFKSGAEYLILQPEGGAIGLVTTTRPVRSSTNFSLNQTFFRSVFANGPQRENFRLGDIFKRTKNESQQAVSNRNFSLLGDPSLKLAIPQKKVVITQLNDKPLEQADSLKALRKIKLKGEVQNPDKLRAENFNGKVFLEVTDKPRTTTTLNTDDPMEYVVRDNKLFRGEAWVQDGQFEVEFFVPKNINYQFGSGKINLYASQKNNLIDAAGATDNIIVGGSVKAADDSNSPEIELFLNDTTFRPGDVTAQNSLLLARLSDQQGINTASEAIGQRITAILDGEEEFVLNDYYKAEAGSYQRGWVKFPLQELENGWHEITLQVWDIHGNMSEATTEFLVTDNQELLVENLLNFPNPFAGATTFAFNHNQAGNDLLVRIEIFTSKGRKIRQLEQTVFDSPGRITSIQWDGKDADGNIPANGIYIFRLTLSLKNSNIKNQSFQKLVLIN